MGYEAIDKSWRPRGGYRKRMHKLFPSLLLLLLLLLLSLLLLILSLLLLLLLLLLLSLLSYYIVIIIDSFKETNKRLSNFHNRKTDIIKLKQK